jgi:hypothetical protein
VGFVDGTAAAAEAEAGEAFVNGAAFFEGSTSSSSSRSSIGSEMSPAAEELAELPKKFDTDFLLAELPLLPLLDAVAEADDAAALLLAPVGPGGERVHRSKKALVLATMSSKEGSAPLALLVLVSCTHGCNHLDKLCWTRGSWYLSSTRKMAP